MADYRERLVRRAARTAARQTRVLQRVNNAFSESIASETRSRSLGDIAADLDALRLAQSVYTQSQTQPIIEQIPDIIGQTRNMMDGGR